MAPNNTAAPSGRPSTKCANAATIATVTAIETVASLIGVRQRTRLKGTGILIPAANKEISTAASVRTSSSADSRIGLKRNSSSPVGPSTSPTAR